MMMMMMEIAIRLRSPQMPRKRYRNVSGGGMSLADDRLWN